MKLSIRTLRPAGLAVIASAFLATSAHGQGVPADAGVSPDAGVPAAAALPVPITILTSNPGTAPGLIFITPQSTVPTSAHGAQIIDNLGRPVWFNPLPAGIGATDLRVQSYHGAPVITWIQSAGQFSTGATTDYIADQHYNVIATVNAGNGLIADVHEFHLTPQGTALITAYNTVPADLSSVGGPTSGLVTEGVIQESDVASGKVLFEWHSLGHVGLDESHDPVSTSPSVAWDYFHVNAVSLDEDGNYLVGARNTWAVYRIDRHSGAVLFRLGGTKSDFTLGPNVAFAWQHNPTSVDDHGLIRIFDNEASPSVLPYSRVIWVRHDDKNKTATLERWFKHPDNLQAGSQGNAEALDNGDTFVEWGALPRFSEFDGNNDLIYDGALPTTYNSYRGYRHEWHAQPDTSPTATATRNDSGDAVVHAVWNGATEVATWDVIDAVNRAGHGPVASAPWNGLDTAISVNEVVDSIIVIARDSNGREIGRSGAVQVAD